MSGCSPLTHIIWKCQWQNHEKVSWKLDCNLVIKWPWQFVYSKHDKIIEINIVLIATNSETRACHFCFYFSLKYHTRHFHQMRFLYDLNDTDILQTGIFGLMNQTDYSPSFITICIYTQTTEFLHFHHQMYIICSDFLLFIYTVLINFSLSPTKQSIWVSILTNLFRFPNGFSQVFQIFNEILNVFQWFFVKENHFFINTHTKTLKNTIYNPCNPYNRYNIYTAAIQRI